MYDWFEVWYTIQQRTVQKIFLHMSSRQSPNSDVAVVAHWLGRRSRLSDLN